MRVLIESLRQMTDATHNFVDENTKFRVSKLKISSLQTENFEFVNSKFRVCEVCELEILSL